MIECPTHGKLHGRKNQKFCPVCGKEAVNVSPLPVLKLYIWKGDLLGTIIVTVVGLFLAWGVVGIRGCNRAEEQQIQQLGQWLTLYYALTSAGRDDDGRTKVLDDFLKTPPTDKLTPEQFRNLVELFGTYDGRIAASAKLKPFVRPL